MFLAALLALAPLMVSAGIPLHNTSSVFCSALLSEHQPSWDRQMDEVCPDPWLFVGVRGLRASVGGSSPFTGCSTNLVDTLVSVTKLRVCRLIQKQAVSTSRILALPAYWIIPPQQSCLFSESQLVFQVYFCISACRFSIQTWGAHENSGEADWGVLLPGCTSCFWNILVSFILTGHQMPCINLLLMEDVILILLSQQALSNYYFFFQGMSSINFIRSLMAKDK